MISNTPLQEVKSRINIEFEEPQMAQLIYDAIILEFNTAPDYRSSMTLQVENNSLIVNIIAEDSTSFRASLNSAIKWIKLSYEINKL